MATKIKLSTGNVGYVWSTYTVTDKSETVSTVKVTAHAYLTDGWVQSTGIAAIITINGTQSTAKTILGNGTYYAASSGTKTASFSVDVAKGTAAKTIDWKVGFWQYTDGTQQTRKHLGTGTASIPRKTSYTVTYKANGGSGAPSAQTKWHGTALELSTDKPTRTGYTFLGWATTSTATAANGSYDPGDTYSTNAALTLYAVWKANTYAVTFNANGGSGAPSAQTKTYGVALTLSSTKPTKANHTFLGWATSKTATAAEYAAGDAYTANAAVTLYAVWQLSYTAPRITGFSVSRCDASKNVTDSGTYCLVDFDWTTDAAASSALIEWLPANGTTWSSKTVTLSGTSGHVSEAVGGSLSDSTTYTVRVTVADASGSNSREKTLATLAYILDILNGGNGIAAGKAAELEGWFDIAYRLLVRNDDDASADDTYSGAMIIGNPDGQHVAFDDNEVQARGGDGWFYVNKEGGNVWIGSADGCGYFPGHIETDGYGYFAEGIKSDVPLELHGLVATCTSALSLGTSSAKITLGNGTAATDADSDGWLSFNDGGIMCNKTGSVLVFGSAYAIDMTAGNALGLTVYRGTAALGGMAAAQTGSRTYTVVHSQPRIFNVTAGQTFYLYAYNAQSATGTIAANARTQLTVVYIK